MPKPLSLLINAAKSAGLLSYRNAGGSNTLFPSFPENGFLRF